MEAARVMRILRRCHGLAATTLAVLLLAGCEGTFTGDLTADGPADPDIAEVNVSLLGLKFEKSGGNTRTLEFTAGEPVDLLALSEGEPTRLFSDEPLADGTYSGVRLLFDPDADATVVDAEGGEFPLKFEDAEYADVDIEVANQKNSSHSLTLTLDLRAALEFDRSNDRYVLTPTVRAVKSDKAARISGAIRFDCPSGRTLARDGAVYLYTGKDVTPDDLDGTEAEPYATTRVTTDDATGDHAYTLRNLASGEYTLALTCEGSDDEPGVDDAIAFHEARNVKVDAGESLKLDLP
jgi:hypothetical protein